MRTLSLALLIFLLAPPSFAGDSENAVLALPFQTPQLCEPLVTSHFFSTDSFLTTAGMSYTATGSLTLQPELGIGYHARDRELHGGVEQSVHRVHARAGWRVSLADTLYLSAAAKLPMVTIESVGLYGGDELGARPDVSARQSYDLCDPTREPLAFRGEVGLHLSPRSDLMLYYDQSPVSGWNSGAEGRLEDRVGTRFILRFE